jgi:hypothetical protein
MALFLRAMAVRLMHVREEIQGRVLGKATSLQFSGEEDGYPIRARRTLG